MPSVSSIFSRYSRLKSTDSLADESQQHGNKLKKRSRLLFSAVNLSRLSFKHDTGRVPREPTPETPKLPSGPMYQNFSLSSRRDASVDEAHWFRGTGERWRRRRLTRVATISDFQQLREDIPNVPPISQGRRSTTVTDYPPIYDRAVEFGKFYRSILPNFESMCNDEPHMSVPDLSISDLSVPDLPGPPHPGSVSAGAAGGSTTPPGTPPPLSRIIPQTNTHFSASSSTTAVGTEGPSGSHFQTPTRQRQPPNLKPSPPPAPRRRSLRQSLSNWPLPLSLPALLRAQTPSPLPSSSPTTAPIPASSVPSPPRTLTRIRAPSRIPVSRNAPQPEPERGRTRTRQTGNSSEMREQRRRTTGLQICTELLTKELANALALEAPRQRDPRERPGGRGGRAPMSRGQMLLMIEAYRGVLERCRREGLREAVEILEHWIGVLGRVYEESCGRG